MKITHISYSDGRGGAAIATYRLHRAMLKYGLDSTLIVRQKTSCDSTVIEIPPTNLEKYFYKKINRLLLPRHFTLNSALRSLNIFPTKLLKFINSLNSDIVQLHWANYNTISISQIVKINKPIIWSQPDMWLFNGSEHYILPTDPLRYIEGYTKHNRPKHEKGLDINKHLWNYKRYHWSKRRFPIVCSSEWLTNCTRSSMLFSKNDVYTIPDTIDMSVFKPHSYLESKNIFGLPKNKKILLFGAIDATDDTRKGYKYLIDVIRLMSETNIKNDICLVVLGNRNNLPSSLHGIQLMCLGFIWDESKLVHLYNAADVLLIPSECDNFPNVVKEATCCGTPTVAFNTSGLSEMIEHKQTGYLATPFDVFDFFEGTMWALNKNHEIIEGKIADKGAELYSPEKCVMKYLSLYNSII